jgi:hypothetical protein
MPDHDNSRQAGNLGNARIQSEIDRNLAEKQKFDMEAREISRRVNTKWYQSKTIGQFIAVFIAALLVAWWVIGVIESYIDKKVEESDLRNRIAMHELTIEFDKVKSANHQLLVEQARAETLATGLQARLKEVSRAYEELSRRQDLSPSQRDIYAQKSREAEAEAVKADSSKAQIQSSQLESQKRLDNIIQRPPITKMQMNPLNVEPKLDTD